MPNASRQRQDTPVNTARGAFSQGISGHATLASSVSPIKLFRAALRTPNALPTIVLGVMAPLLCLAMLWGVMRLQETAFERAQDASVGTEMAIASLGALGALQIEYGLSAEVGADEAVHQKLVSARMDADVAIAAVRSLWERKGTLLSPRAAVWAEPGAMRLERGFAELARLRRAVDEQRANASMLEGFYGPVIRDLVRATQVLSQVAPTDRFAEAGVALGDHASASALAGQAWVLSVGGAADDRATLTTGEDSVLAPHAEAVRLGGELSEASAVAYSHTLALLIGLAACGVGAAAAVALLGGRVILLQMTALQTGLREEGVAPPEPSKVGAIPLQNTAIEAVSTPVAIFDVSGALIYGNPALTELREVHPVAFVADEQVGDGGAWAGADPLFRRLLDALGAKSLDEPARVALQVAGTPLQVRVRPISSQEGGGSVIAEFYDLAVEADMERQVCGLIEKVRGGDISDRLAPVEGDGHNRFFIVGEELNRLADHFAELVADFRATMMALTAGDVTKRASGEYAGEFALLRDKLNQALDKFQETIRAIRSVAREARGKVEEVAGLAAAVAERGGRQADALRQTSGIMSKMLQMVQVNADSAVAAASLSKNTADRARRGQEIVEETIQGMELIEGSSERISDIITVIESIAFQTNLLALNAAVEAARAGESGAGFSVVAAEVRALAQRSSTAARDIKTLITESSAHVSEGSRLVSQTGQALGTIVDGVSTVLESVEEISEASRGQAAIVEEAAAAIGLMETEANESAKTLIRTSNAALEVKGYMGELDGLVGVFTIEPDGLGEMVDFSGVAPGADSEGLQTAA
ncbi:MAG: methyl-accepting chemotaxis protein [Rhodobacteraceae bacterium]|nr:methyl-accepting chemotaxis protein [Paracoccaceae bacterium]